MNSPLISVLMPVKNAQDTVEEAVLSILHQTLENLELIVVDDGSTDGTRALLQKQMDANSRIRLFTASGSGISDALNQALANARAPFVARMDADDISIRHRFKTQYKRFQEAPELVLLGSNVHKFCGATDTPWQSQPSPTKADILKQLQTRTTLMHPTIMARTSALRQVGGYRRLFDGAEDHDLFLRLSRVGEIEILPDTLLKYRIHDKQVSTQSAARGLCASAAAAFCHFCVQTGRADPARTSQSCQQIARGMLKFFAANPAEFTRDHAKLCGLALNSFAQSNDASEQDRALRNQILRGALLSGNVRSAYALWRRTASRPQMKERSSVR